MARVGSSDGGSCRTRCRPPLRKLVQKAGAAQEKVKAALRERGLGYRISEVCFTATFPPQVSFYIASVPAAPPAAEKPAGRGTAKAIEPAPKT